MATDLITQIRATERLAEETIAKAKLEADALVAEAQASATKACQTAEAEGRRKAAQALEAAKSAGRADAVRLEVESKAEAEQIRQLAAARLDAAIKRVMERIVKA